MQTVFVLLMVIGGATWDAGLASIQQEFSSLERCEAAQKSMEESLKSKSKPSAKVHASVCVQK